MKQRNLIYILVTILILILSVFLFKTDSDLEFKDSINYWVQYVFIGLTLLYIFIVYTSDDKKNNTHYYLISHSLIIIGLLYLTFKDYLVFNGDNFHYIINGRSLFETGQIQDTHTLGSPRSAINPPFLPMLISFVYSIVGENFTSIKILISILYLSSSIFFYFLILGFTKRRKVSLALSIIVFSSPFLLHSSSMIMTETPFLFTSIGSLLSFQKFINEKSKSKKYYFFLSLVMLTSLLTYFSRMIGICLVPTYLLYLLRDINLKENFKSILNSFEAKRFLVFSLLIGLTFGGRFVYENYTSEIDKNSEIKAAFNLDKITQTFDSQVTIIPVLIDQNTSFRKYANFAYDLNIEEHSSHWNSIYIFILLGMCLLIYKNNFISYYLIFGFLIITIGSKVSDLLAILRYMSIFLPLYIYVILVGFEFALEKLRVIFLSKNTQAPKIMNYVVFTSFLILYCNTVLGLGYLVQIEQNKKITNQPYHISQSNFFEMAKWCRANLDNDNQYVMSRKPRMFTVYANMPSCRTLSNRTKSPLNSEVVFSDLEKKHVKYVVIDTFSKLSQEVMVPLLNANKDRFRLVKQFGSKYPAYLFEILEQ